MKLSGHYIILQNGFVPVIPVDFAREKKYLRVRINNIRRLRRNPRKAAICAERCTDETVSLTASRSILHGYRWFFKVFIKLIEEQLPKWILFQVNLILRLFLFLSDEIKGTI